MTSPCTAEAIWFSYRPDRWVLKGVTLDVPPQAFLSVLGPSGAGKTTLIKALAGLLTPQKGTVTLLGQPTAAGVDPEVRRRVGYIPQQLGLVRSLTAMENVLLGALGRERGVGTLVGVFPKREVDQARRHLALLGIEHKAAEKVFRLSGGERQRVAIARTLLQGPALVFADEFVSDLDMPRAAQVLRSMRELAHERQMAFVINLHDVPLVQELASEVVILKDGRIVHRGAAGALSATEVSEALA